MRTATGGKAPRLAEAATGSPLLPPRTIVSDGHLGPRFLAYLATLALLVGLFERWDLLGGAAVLAVVVGVMVFTVAGFSLALRRAGSATESAGLLMHYLVPLMAVAVAAAVSYLIQDWRFHLASQGMMGIAIMASSYVTLERFLGRERPGHEFLMNAAAILILLGAYLSILVGTTSVPLRLAAVFAGTGLAAYELLGRVAAEQARAIVASLIVAQIVTTVAFAMISLQFVDNSRLAGILLVAWYVNRDLARHLFEGTLTRNILAEYSVGLVLIAALIASALLSR
ncbi:MAG TPA: hypothetical protein VGR61_05450 [Candidatus Dormibacteraeota bacterium]|nr:hypothetical protein [Candidatus Dormibacteraeota bacterium]